MSSGNLQNESSGDFIEKPPFYIEKRRIRKLRRKLQEIEVLELIGRELNDVEAVKIGRKDEFRSELLSLAEYIEEEEMKRSTNNSAREDYGEPVTKASSTEPSTTEKERPSGKPRPAAEAAASAQSVKKSQNQKPKEQPKEKDPIRDLRKTWAKKHFELNLLEGHTDIILCVDISAKYIISGSRDTSVKLWNADTGALVLNMGGHTNAVNCVKLITGRRDEGLIGVSGSDDCSIKFWDLSSGECLKSEYMFNAVMCLCLLSDNRIAVGLSGGKLEVFNSTDLSRSFDASIHAEDIICLVCNNAGLLASGCVDGSVKVFEVSESAVRCLYQTEETVVNSVKSLAFHGDTVFVGDDGPDVHRISWRAGASSRLANHRSDFGVTDDMVISEDVLLSSAYDYDRGCGFMNIHSMNLGITYMTTLKDLDVKHILSLATYPSAQRMRIVTGGSQLVIWQEVLSRNDDSVKCQTLDLLIAGENVYSSSGEEDEVDAGPMRARPREDNSFEDGEPKWWCNLL